MPYLFCWGWPISLYFQFSVHAADLTTKLTLTLKQIGQMSDFESNFEHEVNSGHSEPVPALYGNCWLVALLCSNRLMQHVWKQTLIPSTAVTRLTESSWAKLVHFRCAICSLLDTRDTMSWRPNLYVLQHDQNSDSHLIVTVQFFVLFISCPEFTQTTNGPTHE